MAGLPEEMNKSIVSVYRSFVPELTTPIRIAWIFPTLDYGGAERQYLELARAIDKRLFDPHFILLNDRHRLLDDQYGRIDGVSIHIVTRRKSFDPRRLTDLVQLLRQVRPDLIHTVLPTANLWGLLAARLLGIRPCIGSLRSLHHSRWNRWYWIDRLSLKYLADAVVVNSDTVRENGVRMLGIKSEKILRIFNGFSAQSIPRRDRTSTLAALGVSRLDRPVLSIIGRLDANKSVGDVLCAVRILRKNGCPVTLLVAGDGVLRQSLREQVRRDGLDDSVFFPGPINPLHPLLGATDILICASRSEGFSNVVCEAIGLDVPVAVTDIPFFRELFGSGHLGFFFEPGNPESLAHALREMISDPQRTNQVAAQARAAVQSRFPLEAMVWAHQDAYRNWAGEKRP